MEGRMMGCMIPHLVVGEVDTRAGPRPHCTSDIEAMDALRLTHAGRMAREAAHIAASCPPVQRSDEEARIAARAMADAAARDAEVYRNRLEQRRVFLADRLRGLHDAGRLTKGQYRAAVEIGDLIAWIEAGKQVMSRSQFSERLAASTSTIALHQALEEAERLRYGPWRAWASAFQIKPGRTVEDLVRAFVTQRFGVRQAGCVFAMDQRRAEALLVRALARYAAIGRWEDEGEALARYSALANRKVAAKDA